MFKKDCNDCNPPVRKAGPYCGPVDTTPVGKPYNSHADCPTVPDCGYHIPPVAPYPPGTSLEFQMQGLNQKMNELICNFNGCVDNYEKVKAELLNSFCCNEAYYNEVWTEDYLDPTMNATVHVVHIPFVDNCGRPIRLDLGLAYDNTGNTGVTEEAFHASKRVLADKLFPANATDTGSQAFVGPVIWKGAPYNYGTPVSRGNAQAPTNILGVTKSGFFKVYPLGGNATVQAATITQMQKDGIENAMQALAYVLDSTVVSDPTSLIGPFVGVGMNFSTRERFIILVETTPEEVSGSDIAALFTKYNCTVGVLTCWGENASLMDKGQFVAMPATVETSSTDPATQVVPEYNSFWYISKACTYNSEYTKEVADLMQDFGSLEWKYNMSLVAIESNNRTVAELNQKIEQETSDREEADEEINNRITQEVATLNESIQTVQENLDDAVDTLNNRITQEVNTLNERIDSEVETLNQTIQEEVTRAEAAEDALDQKIEAETSRATEAENDLNQKIEDETERATQAEDTLDTKIEAETTAREEAVSAEAATRAANDIVSVELIQDGTKNTYRLKTGGNTYLEVPIELYDYALLVSKMQDLTNVQQNLAAEVEARQTADDEIRASVTTEASARQSADTNLQNQINTLSENQSNYVEKAGDTMSGDLNMGSHKVTGLATPTGNTDAATKQYVDNAVSGDYLPTDGGTMNGDIDMNGNTIQNVAEPVNAQDVATKEYVDGKASGDYLPLSGGTMSGILNMGDYAINDVSSLLFTNNTQLGTYNYDDTNYGLSVHNGNTFSVQYLFSSYVSRGKTENSAGILFGSGNKTINFGIFNSSGEFEQGNYLNSPILRGVGTPEYGQDAANKKYVDDAVAGINLSNYLPLSGGTMRGSVDMNGASITNAQLLSANDIYVRYIYNGFDMVDASTPTPAIHLGTSNISLGYLTEVDNFSTTPVLLKGVDTPVDGTDAVNKSYVDTQLQQYLPLSGGTLTGPLKFGYVLDSVNFEPQIQVVHNNSGYDIFALAVSRTGGFSDSDNYAGINFSANEEKAVFQLYDHGNSGTNVYISGVEIPTSDYQAANKLYVDGELSLIATTTNVTIFPLSTGDLALVSQSGKIEDKTGVIYATARYRVATEISGDTRIALQNTVSGNVIPTNIAGVVNACLEDDGPGMMRAIQSAFYEGWTYLYTTATLPIGEIIDINFIGFKEV